MALSLRTSLSTALRPSLLLAAVVVAASGCSGGGPLMEPEAAPLAPAAVAGVDGLAPYLEAYGIAVVQIFVAPAPEDPLIEERYSLDLGVRGRCSIETFYTAAAAQQVGARSANEVRDLRAPISTDLLRGPAPRGRPGVANNPTFLFGRFVALCGQDATVRRAFKALELYARDASEVEGADAEATEAGDDA